MESTQSSGKIRVLKFGGTSVGSPERILKVADRVEEAHRAGDRLVIVVSAMGRTTDELLELASKVSSNPPHREVDMLLTAGERISMALLSMALADRGVPALSFTGSQSGIITTSHHRRARIRRILGDRLRQALSIGKVAIVAGFQGVSEEKEITTLGRGGSDTTAVALAAALKAERCEIFTDVDGVYSADPGVVPGAKLWKRLPAHLMTELAVRGAGVLHPRCVQLASRHGIPIWVGNSMRDGSGPDAGGAAGGTMIVKADSKSGRSEDMEDFTVVGVTTDDDRELMAVDLARATIVSSLFEMINDARLTITAPFFQEGRVCFFVDRSFEEDWKTLMARMISDGFVSSYRIHDELVPLTVVGEGFGQEVMALTRVIDVLKSENIEVTIGALSPHSITVAVRRNLAEEGIQALHKEFIGGGAQ